MQVKKQRGFTLVEVIVVAGIIAILAGALIPLILKEIDESRISRAYADLRSISAAILVMKKDTAKWPNLDGTCAAGITLLNGGGNMPSNLAGANYDETSTNTLDNYLMMDSTGCYGAKWKGPYLASATPDPWGNAYVINVTNTATSNPVWLISAGPDGTMDTDGNGVTLWNDDVGIRLK